MEALSFRVNVKACVGGVGILVSGWSDKKTTVVQLKPFTSSFTAASSALPDAGLDRRRAFISPGNKDFVGTLNYVRLSAMPSHRIVPDHREDDG